jgi:hypothetical protein
MDQVVERFHRRHEELYTYSMPGQEAVLVNARVAVIGLLPSLPAERESEGESRAEAKPKSRRAYLGRWVEVPVYDLDTRLRRLAVCNVLLWPVTVVSVLLRGADSLLSRLDRTAVVPYVDVTGLGKGTHTVPVLFDPKGTLTLQSIRPTQVTVTIN